MATLWGEMPATKSADSGLSAARRDQISKPRLQDVEGPRLHQPSSRHHPPTNEPLNPERFQLDGITVHTIRLLQHARKMRQIVQAIHQQQEAVKGTDGEVTYPVAPPIPEYTRPPPKHPQLHPIPFLPRSTENESDFVKGIGDPPPIIDDIANRKLLRRSVAAICAHTGFEGGNESVLETMTDVTHEYYLQFTKRMRAAADNYALKGESGFPDIIEQTFHEMGLGSVTELHDFYQSRIVNYHTTMEQTCHQLMAEYEKLKLPHTPRLLDTVPVIRIKEEASSEIQFPELDDEDEDNNTEKLLQLEGLGGLEITVEHESTSGLMTEETRWSQNLKNENQEAKAELDNSDDTPYVRGQCPSPQQIDITDSMTDPGSVSTSDIMSPPSITSMPSRPKKKKKS